MEPASSLRHDRIRRLHGVFLSLADKHPNWDYVFLTSPLHDRNAWRALSRFGDDFSLVPDQYQPWDHFNFRDSLTASSWIVYQDAVWIASFTGRYENCDESYAEIFDAYAQTITEFDLAKPPTVPVEFQQQQKWSFFVEYKLPEIKSRFMEAIAQHSPCKTNRQFLPICHRRPGDPSQSVIQCEFTVRRTVVNAFIAAAQMVESLYNAESEWIGPKPPAEWAKLFKLSWETIKDRISKGQIRAQEINSKSWRIRASDIPK